MIVNSFQISNELRLTPLAPERAAEVVQNKDARIWLDVQTAEPAEIEAWLDTLGIMVCLDGFVSKQVIVPATILSKKIFSW